MRKLILNFIIIIGLIPLSTAFGQNSSFPKWIKGTWNNSYESNTNNFVFWTFSNDSIFMSKKPLGNKSDRESLIKKYSGYLIERESRDSLFRISFSKVNKIVIYEFKLQKVDYSDKPDLTYSLTINGNVKREHSSSCNLVFTK